MSIFKTPYEISVWEDRLTLVDFNNNEYNDVVPEGIQIKTSYFKEIKLFVIGTNNTNSPIFICEPQLKQNINGQNTLTFSIYSKYYNEEKNIFVSNPFIPFLVSERKIKLKFYQKGKVKWLDFVIKKIEENSENYKYTYTATDLFINELSKNGFNLIFDTELENNQGTVNELGNAVLQGTDWQIGENSENIQQFQEEALYKIILKNNIKAINIKNEKEQTFSKGEVIYGFYSSIINENYQDFQFIYNKDGIYLKDDNRVVYNVDNFFIPKSQLETGMDFIEIAEFTSEYRGKRIVRHQEIVYDDAAERYVKVYTDSGNNLVYGYQESKYVSEQLAQSVITNGKDFTSIIGWQQNSNKPLSIQTIPDYNTQPNFNVNRQKVLKYIQEKNNFLFNSGFSDNINLIQQISQGDCFIYRIKCGFLENNQITSIDLSKTQVLIKITTYKTDKFGKIIPDQNFENSIIASIPNGTLLDTDDYLFGMAIAQKSVSMSELKNNKYGIFITFENFDNNYNQTFYIQDVQFFKRVFDQENRICLPDSRAININLIEDGKTVIEQKLLAYTTNFYYFYYPNIAKTKEEIKYIDILTSENFYQPKYMANFEKIRSISASETNRFDLLQTLCETFECWCKFDVKHKDTGEIMLGKDIKKSIIDAGNSVKVMDGSTIYNAGKSNISDDSTIIVNKEHNEYQQQKFITFHKDIGQENSIGFSYGINLKSIKRTVESDNIISKLIVKNNNNEFAPYGSCSIARAKENPSGENSLYNFNYFIKQGLLNYENLSNDLYSLEEEKGWIGYYTRLKNINNQISNLVEEQEGITKAYNSYNAEYQAILLQFEANAQLLRENEEYFYKLTQYTYDTIDSENQWLKEKNVIALCSTITNLRTESKKLEEKVNFLKNKVNDLMEQNKNIDLTFTNLIKNKEKIKEKFEKKYSKYIQEGPWVSEDYVDDNLYYLDAESTLYNSSQPQVKYTIDVIEISQLEDFKNYNFELGDVTYIQDPEFFGWTFKDGIKVPFKEKIVVTEITINFDSPEKNTIKVQNYRTQFEDLFQRLTATTQQIEFHSGNYERVANIVKEDGSIKSEVLQEVFANNINNLQNASNESVIWDETGITSKNLLSSNEIVRITSGGIYLTNDAGKTWSTGITGRGINAKTITTGQLNTELITILNGDQPSFRWDALGINAYYKKSNGYYDNKTYVRFDQFGIYGVKDLTEDFEPTTEQDVWSNANFALTWKGFLLRTKGKDGSISIDSEKDFNVYDANERELIRIGQLTDSGDYGLRIKNAQGTEAFVATQKKITMGGWEINEEGLHSNPTEDIYEVHFFSKELVEPLAIFENLKGVQSVSRTDWSIVAGDKFGVTSDGTLYANNANITGRIQATSGTIGGITIDDNGQLLVPSDKVAGLNVISSDKETLFYADVNEHLAKISQWDITSNGLKYTDEDSNEILITPTGIQINKQNVSWIKIFNFINENTPSEI